jgi:hypothetical protein
VEQPVGITKSQLHNLRNQKRHRNECGKETDRDFNIPIHAFAERGALAPLGRG